MFLVKAGTVIQIEAPKSLRSFNWGGWIPYATKLDKIYDSHEVWDAVAVYNEREDIPMWAKRNIADGYIIIKRAGKFAMVPRKLVEYLD
jgi:hypothetical protein